MKTRQIIMYAGFGMTIEQINVRVFSDLDTTLLKPQVCTYSFSPLCTLIGSFCDTI